jgi:hypothetical protein
MFHTVADKTNRCRVCWAGDHIDKPGDAIRFADSHWQAEAFCGDLVKAGHE